MPKRPVELSDFEANFNRFSVANLPRLVVAWIDSSSKEEGVALNQRRSLKDLMSARNKGATSQEVLKSQVPLTLRPPPPPLPTDLGLHAIGDLKKKRPIQVIEEGELPP